MADPKSNVVAFRPKRPGETSGELTTMPDMDLALLRVELVYAGDQETPRHKAVAAEIDRRERIRGVNLRRL